DIREAESVPCRKSALTIPPLVSLAESVLLLIDGHMAHSPQASPPRMRRNSTTSPQPLQHNIIASTSTVKQ
ncbi:hypothetical protein BaRGS_00017491, partial [Batillaria attramentaria]